MFDLLFEDAIVLDGTGGDGYVASVGVKDGKVAYIGKDRKGARESVCCKGLMLTPGFIDIHSHSEFYALKDRTMAYKLAQGVTLDVGGNCGIGVFPIKGSLEELKGLCGDVLGTWDDWAWDDFKSFKAYLERHGLGINLMELQAHSALRSAAMKGSSNRVATDSEISAMCDMLSSSLESGACGLSSGLYYAPCLFADRKELLSLLKVVADHDSIFTVHHRCEGDDVLTSLEEVLSLSLEAGNRLEVSHLKAIGMRNQCKVDRMLSLIDEYRENGLDVKFDQYPYTYGSTSLFSFLPPDALRLERDDLRLALKDKANRDKWRDEIINPVGWDSIYTLAGPGNVTLVKLDNTPEAEGRTLLEYSDSIGKDSIEALFDILSRESGAAVMTDVTQSEENLMKIMSSPLMCFGSDSLYSSSMPHPRSMSATVEFLSIYARDKGMFTPGEAIRRLTGEAASRLRLRDRGLIKEGYAADLALIDWDKLSSGAEMGKPFASNPGIVSAYVAGTLSYGNGHATGALNGKVL